MYDGKVFVSTVPSGLTNGTTAAGDTPDGEPTTGTGWTVSGLQNNATITAGVVTSSAKDIATYTGDGTTGTSTITTTFATSDDITNYNVVYDFTQVITARDLLIEINDTKVYDGTPLETDYTEATATGLQNGATLNAGVVTTPSKDVAVYTDNTGANITTAFGTTDGITNYNVTYSFRQEITLRDLLIEINDTKTYDGTPLVTDYTEATATGLQNGATLNAGVVTTPSKDVAVYTDNTGANITTAFETTDDITNYNVTYSFRQEITKRNLYITGNLTKVYDGTPFEVHYNELTYNGLVDGDMFTDGIITTDGYQVGVYHCRDNRFLRMMDELLAYNSNFGPASVTRNYAPYFDVTLEISTRSLVITAKSTTKEYDGTSLTVSDLTAPGYDITSGTLGTGDDITSVDLAGSIICVGDSASKISNAVIMHGTDDVTESYSITYVNGHLIVTPVSTSLVCPANLNITLWYGRCDTMVVLPAMATLTPAVDNTTIVNDLALQNPLPVGTHHITWNLLDACGNVMQSCTQTVTVQFPPCEPVFLDGRTYSAERIGCDCWITENLRNEHYSDGTDISNFSSYRNSSSLEETYGKLYSWYSAVRVPEGNDTQAPADSMAPTGAYVQGICPQGWALPTMAEYQTMFQASGGVAGLVKSPSSNVWLPGKQGTAPNSFNAFGAGYYDANIGRYTNLLGEAHFWTSDYTATSPVARNFVLNYYCEDGLDETADRDFGFSIRCVRKK